MDLLKDVLPEGRGQTKVVNVPDDAKNVLVTISRFPGYPYVEQATGGSPFWYSAIISQNGKDWKEEVGGNVKGGDWDAGRGLEWMTLAQASLDPGQNRVFTVLYECRTEMAVMLNVSFY